MTREEAKDYIYEIINSGIIDLELENHLTEVATCICEESFEDWCDGTFACEGCKHCGWEIIEND